MPKLIEVPTIYCITTKHNNKRYIGSTITYRRRKSQHFSKLKYGQHYCYELQKEYDRLGEDCIEFSVVEEVHTDDIQVLRKREQYYIDTLSPEYNVSGTSKPKSYSDKWHEAVYKRNVERVRTAEENKKRAESIKDFYRHNKKPPMKLETKEKLRQANLGKNNPNWGVYRSEESRKRTADSECKFEYTLQSPSGEKVVFINSKHPETTQHVPPRWIIKRLLTGEVEILEGKHAGWRFIGKRRIRE